MKKTYINGTILRVEDYIENVVFTKKDYIISDNNTNKTNTDNNISDNNNNNQREEHGKEA